MLGSQAISAASAVLRARQQQSDGPRNGADAPARSFSSSSGDPAAGSGREAPAPPMPRCDHVQKADSDIPRGGRRRLELDELDQPEEGPEGSTELTELARSYKLRLKEESTAQGSVELAAVLSAKGCIETALRELSATLGRAQAQLERASGALHLESAGTDGSKVVGALHLESVGHPVSPRANSKEASNEPPPARHSVIATSDAALNRAGSPKSHTFEGQGDSWPASLVPRLGDPDLGKMAVARTHSAGSMILQRSTGFTNLQSESMAMDSTEKERRGKPWYVVHPNSTCFMVWNIGSACLLLFDLVFIPWMLAWDVPLEGELFYVACATAAFWTSDIFLTFVTAYHSNGEIVTDLQSIRWRYLKSWFAADLAIVSCDWVSMLLSTSKGWKTLRFAKAGRLLRLFVVARMLKVYHVISDIIDERLSGYARLSFRFVKMFCVTLACSHLISCLWFYIGREGPTDTGLRWVTSSALADTTFEDVAYQYFTCFHWAIAQICLGAMEVNSVTTLERAYNIICLILGLLFGSMLVSSLSAAMLEVQMDMRDVHLKMQLLRRFLREQEVNHILAVKVERQVAERLALKDKVKEGNVVGFALLSSSLRSELKLDLFGRHLKTHSLFGVCMSLDLPQVVRICRTCTEYLSLRSQDDLFPAGKKAEWTYYYISGALEYTQEPESAPVAETTVITIDAECWIAEAGLWSHWFHVGSVRARRASELVGLRLEKFKETLQRSSVATQLIYAYGKQFCRHLRNARPPATAWPDDLQVPVTDWSDIVFSMDERSQRIIGMDAIHTSTRHAHTWKLVKEGATVGKLAKEVEEGKCTVMLNAEGQMERVVSVAVLEIRNLQGQMLAQIGKSEAGQMKACCRLPAGKQERGELVGETVERLLESKMSSFGARLQVTGRLNRDVKVMVSPEYGIRTKYLRCTTILSLDHDLGHADDVLVISPDDWTEAYPSGSMLVETGPFNRTTSGNSASSCQAVAQAAAVENLLQREAFCIVDRKGVMDLYAWFDDPEFQEFSSAPSPERLLGPWVHALDARAREMQLLQQAQQKESGGAHCDQCADSD